MRGTGDQTLSDVKVGDKVIHHSGGAGTLSRIETVERITKTQVITDRGRYSKRTGRSVGSADIPYSSWIKTATQEEIEEVRRAIRRRDMIYTMGRVRWVDLPAEVLDHAYRGLLESGYIPKTGH